MSHPQAYYIAVDTLGGSQRAELARNHAHQVGPTFNDRTALKPLPFDPTIHPCSMSLPIRRGWIIAWPGPVEFARPSLLRVVDIDNKGDAIGISSAGCHNIREDFAHWMSVPGPA